MALAWQLDAACLGKTRLFFPRQGDDHETMKILTAEICARCPVIEACRADTDDYERSHEHIHGYRHGMSAEERRAALTARQQGKRRMTRDKAQRLRAVAVMLEAGFTATEMAGRLDTTKRTIERLKAELKEADAEQLLLCG